jgi:hypothetical protein
VIRSDTDQTKRKIVQWHCVANIHVLILLNKFQAVLFCWMSLYYICKESALWRHENIYHTWRDLISASQTRPVSTYLVKPAIVLLLFPMTLREGQTDRGYPFFVIHVFIYFFLFVCFFSFRLIRITTYH